MAGVYQHFSNPALNLIKIINSIKKDGLIYLGFYRSGEFKYFIVDSIRHLINKSMIRKIREFNSAIYCLNEFNHYQSSRVMDDFFIPHKHNFHPKDIIHDFKKLKMKIIYIDNDMREYNHESKKYFSIGADRIYAKKQNDVLIKNSLIKNLKTIKGKNQIEDLKYKHKIIIQNVKLIKSIKYKFKKKHFSEESIISLALSLYQLTRPFKFSKSYYYSLAKKNGKHKTINLMLKNFMKNFDQSSKKNRLFNKSMKNLVKNKL